MAVDVWVGEEVGFTGIPNSSPFCGPHYNYKPFQPNPQNVQKLIVVSITNLVLHNAKKFSLGVPLLRPTVETAKRLLFFKD